MPNKQEKMAYPLLGLLFLAVAMLFSSCASVYILNNNSSQYETVKFKYTPIDLDSSFYYKKLVAYQKQGIVRNIEVLNNDSTLGFNFQMAPRSKLGLNKFFWFYKSTVNENKELCLPASEDRFICYKVTDNNFSSFRQRAVSKGAIFSWLGKPQYYIYLMKK